jgi:tricorn protease
MPIGNRTWQLLFVLVMLLAGTQLDAQQDYLKRFPAIHDDVIVFTAGEDLWRVASVGGTAERLTFDAGVERYPRFSPDGALLAFTAQFDGNTDVYVMGARGGEITRLTYHPAADEVIGWHAGKNKIIFRSARMGYARYSRLFLISADGSGLEEIPLNEAARGSFSADGEQIAFNKDSRETRTWKRYQGGRAQEIYIYNFRTGQEQNISNFKGTDRMPMWIGETIYFTSDRQRRLNIFAYDVMSGDIRQITRHEAYDVRRPSHDDQHIVYELGGEIYRLDLSNGETRQVPIRIYQDPVDIRPYWLDVSDMIRHFSLAPTGKVALLEARGDIFTVPVAHGPGHNLTQSSGARDRGAEWSPDGKAIAWFSDRDGEYQIYLQNADGSGQARALTKFTSGYPHTLRWSPDGSKLSYTDQTLTLYVLDVASGKITEIARASHENIDVAIDKKPVFDHNWSPDSRYLAYVLMNAQQVYQIHIHDLRSGKSERVSHELFNDFNPVFSSDGNYLYFLSNRRFSPTLGDFEWEMVYKDMAGIYSLKLNRRAPLRFPLQNDRHPEMAATSKSEVDVEIEFDGLSERIEAFPLPRGNYRDLQTHAGAVFYRNKDKGDFNRFEFRRIGPMDVLRFDFAAGEEKKVIAAVDAYRLSADGEQLTYMQNGKAGIVSARGDNAKGTTLNHSDLKTWFAPRAEWQQLFNEAWRLQRDYYYEPGMHGLDWTAERERYQPLIAKAVCRQDVRFVIGELIGELNTSHTYVFGGDQRRQLAPVGVGLLGADVEADTQTGRYRLRRILRTADFTDNAIPPLARADIEVQTGDYILAVNGREITTEENFYSYFVGLAGKQVAITIHSEATLRGARTYHVETIRDDRNFRYRQWVEDNRAKVDEMSEGRIGYLHFPDTYMGSAEMFAQYFYSQTRKQGLVIDARFNGGGLDPEIFLRRLARQPHSYWTRRYSQDQTSPMYAGHAHMVCITNRQAGSGGDEFPFEFRQFGMGPVIGTRTWGGLVGVSMFIEMIDGGGLTAPDYRIYHTDGTWIVENEGVTPDIIIDLDSGKAYQGEDAQLRKAIELIENKIVSEPQQWPKHPPFPQDN